MDVQGVIAIAALGFFVIGGLLLARSVWRGRAVLGEFELRFPHEYEELGRPYPGFFQSSRRNAYNRFLMQSQFAELNDPYLVDRLTDLRRSELRMVKFLLIGFGVLGVAALWFEFIYSP